MTVKPRYRWAFAYDWLEDKIHAATEAELHSFALAMAQILDSDAIQDLFQSEMQADGFFNDLNAVDELSRDAQELDIYEE